MKKINKTIAIVALAFAATFSAQSANAQTVSGTTIGIEEKADTVIGTTAGIEEKAQTVSGTTAGIEGKTQTVIGEDATAGLFNNLEKIKEEVKKNLDNVPSFNSFIKFILFG